MAGFIDETPPCWWPVHFTYVPQHVAPLPAFQGSPSETEGKAWRCMNTLNSPILGCIGHLPGEHLQPGRSSLDQLGPGKRQVRTSLKYFPSQWLETSWRGRRGPGPKRFGHGPAHTREPRSGTVMIRLAFQKITGAAA